MFRYSSSLRLSLRFLYTRIATTDPLLDKLKNSTNKYHIFQLVGVNRPMLTLEHVTCAMNLLWKFHKENHKTLRNVDQIREHPEFVALCTVMENNIGFMDDRELVNILNIVDSLQVDAHSSLMQRLVTEGWKRLQRLDLSSLSTFAVYLRSQDMTTSPLMGQIANIVDACLDNIEDPGTISSFTSSLYAVSSPHLWERLVRKMESILEKLNASHFDDVLHLMTVFRNERSDLPLIKKCDRLLYKNAGALDLQTVYSIMRMYSLMHFFKSEFVLSARGKLIEEVDRCDHPELFANLFFVLSPIVSFKMRERLEKKLLNLENKMSVKDLLDVLKKMKQTECKNPVLIQKICSGLQKHLEALSSSQLCNITEAVVFLHYKGYSLRNELQTHLKRRLLSSFLPSEVANILKSLFLLNSSEVDDTVLSKVHDIIPQSNFNSLTWMNFVVTQLLQFTNTHFGETLKNLHEELCSYRLERVNGFKCLGSLLHELQYKDNTSEIDMVLAEAILQNCLRLVDQVNWKNVVQLSILVLRINTYCSPLLERIAAVTLDNLDKISPWSIYPILSVFSYLNLKPSQGDDFMNACTKLVVNNMDVLSPHSLLLTTYTLVIAGYFPRELINAIFNTNFLLRLDAQLDAFDNGMTPRLRTYLMDLNRAVCIEHPELGVPWFHEQYCQQMRQSEQRSTDPQVQQLLKQMFGGTNYIKFSVRAPYSYSIDFEYVLDKKGNPIAYVEENALTPDSSSVFEPDSQLQEDKPLPAGAQRIAVDLLHSGALLRNSNHLKGHSAMKKRHLEILGYQVVQIPYHLWKGCASFQNRLPGNFTAGNC